MSKYLVRKPPIIAYLSILFFVLSSNQAFAVDFVVGKIVGVSDGDTVTLLDDSNRERKIRLARIDAPEGGQAFGAKSKEALSKLCYGKRVKISISTKDCYGREVATIYDLAGKDINSEMVKIGFAWWYRKYAPEDSQLERIEREARENKYGLWKDKKPIPPWKWRRGERGGGELEALKGKLIGNRRSGLYFFSDCQGYYKISPKNRIFFDDESEALSSGFSKSRSCPK